MTTPKSSKITLEGLHQVQTLSNIPLDSEFDDVILLLHGYSEDAKRIYKRLGRKINETFGEDSKTLIIAANGLYPLPKAFPLEKSITEADDLLQGFAWYFYHAGTNTFLIDYKIPAETLGNWCEKLTQGNKPLTVIGYSQGGYLAPFVGFNVRKRGIHLKKVIGINCSFRVDMMEETPDFPMDLIQGENDTIIDRKLAKERFDKLKEKGVSGEYTSIPNADHKLCPKTAEVILKKLKGE